MEFLRLLLGRHFAGKPVVGSRDVGCFSGQQTFLLSVEFFEETREEYSWAYRPVECLVLR